jgi:hypothetical protein
MCKKTAVGLMALFVVGAIAAPASAALMHPLVSSFTGSGTPEGSMLPVSVAVDNSSSGSAGHVYVGELAPRVVNEFSAAGTYLCQITGAGSASTSPSECDSSGAGVPEATFGPPAVKFPVTVDSTGDMYVGNLERHAVYVFSPAGAYLSEIALPKEGTPAALAVNGAGDVLIAAESPDKAHGIVYKFVPKSSRLESLLMEGPSGRLSQIGGLASDDDPSSSSYGDVYVLDNEAGGVLVYDATGAYLSSISTALSRSFAETAIGVAVDPSNGDLYVTVGGGIDEFAPGGAFLSRIELPNEASPGAVAFNSSSHDVYVSSLFGQTVYVFGPGVVVPTVTATAPVSVQPTGVTLHGAVDPASGGEVTACVFEWGETSAYGKTAACSPSPGYTSPTEVDSAPITGLAPDTAYHFRLSATNANGTEHSADGTFETTGKPTLEDETTVVARQTEATVQAVLNPHGFATTYQVEYGLCGATCPSSYEAAVPVSGAGAGSGVTAAVLSQEITGLQRNAEYHYRFVATNSQGTAEAEDQTFKTAAGATAEYRSATAGPHSAEIVASIDPAGEAASCRVEYVGEAGYKASQYASARSLLCTPSELAANAGERTVHVNVTGLAIDAVYHYRFILSSASGEATALEGTVATFGVEIFAFEMLGGAGNPYTQAGGHPDSVTMNIVFAQTDVGGGLLVPSGNVKDVRVELPAGFVGNPSATATCTRRESEEKECSGAAQVGTIVVQGRREVYSAPLFNIAPPRGVAAELGARFNNFANAFIDTKVRTGGDYGIDAESLSITALVPVSQVTVKVWGVPSATSHDGERACPEKGNVKYEIPCAAPERGPVKPFLTAPGSCSGVALQATVFADAYQAPGEFVTNRSEMSAMEGCGKLPFAPGVSVAPESGRADSPTGLDVGLRVPQEESAGGLAEADVRNVSVMLPAGLTVNPAAAGGLAACSEGQIELHGPQPAGCPEASKIGSVELETPLFPHRVFKGGVYVAAQTENPFGSLLAIYVAIDEPELGVVVKLAGHVELGEPFVSNGLQPGQIRTTFDNNPQLPFENLRLSFSGGPRAALVTPSACGSYTSSASLTSWASSTPTEKSSAFQITSGPGGSGCAAPGFVPRFTAGTPNNQAGGYSPFSATFARQDGEETLGRVSVTTPPGLLGILKSVVRCPEPQAGKGECAPGSEIGEATVAIGAGPNPYWVRGGKVYLTDAYGGGPFGLSIVVPTTAGPFTLAGNGGPGKEVVRASISVDPSTAQITVTSDPLPSILDGVPLQIRTASVTISRPGFIFNPTNCNKLQVKGTILSGAGTPAAVSSPFTVGNCAHLPFKPRFTALTSARASKARGASLHVKVTSGPGQANIAKVKVDLPLQLPSRLSTLQKACLAAVFASNPAACPSASVVGVGTAVTPVLSSTLRGPAYLVSHGGAAFPDLEIVLQGEGITLILDGQTQIKKGITSSIFRAVPDAPINSFDLVLPQGPHSVLAAFGSLCKGSLNMPTVITGQNGAVIKQTTKIAVTGCPKVKAKKVTKRHKAKKGHKAKGSAKRGRSVS